MLERIVKRIDLSITVLFSILFFVTPLIMFPQTSELFELNKMWFVYGISILIASCWVAKIVITKRFNFRRTPLDIPLFLFLLSQTISTILSIEPHTSVWGYYSRFNGGLLSLFTYIFLYYAFASNFFANARGDPGGRAPDGADGVRSEARLAGAPTGGKPGAGPRGAHILLLVSLLSGAIVALWGIPSHFGHDPSCLIFRGTLDVSCWTEAFQPKIRIFSTLGQPNWLAAYLAILLTIAIGYAVSHQESAKPKKLPAVALILLVFLLYLTLLYTKSQSGFLGFWVGNIIFILFYCFIFLRGSINRLKKLLERRSFQLLILINIIFLATSFVIGLPIQKLNQYSYHSLVSKVTEQKKERSAQQAKQEEKQPDISQGELGGTDSGKIRLIVWRGAFELFKAHPFFGTGVETFAYAYYNVRPQEHNLTSEWDYLYNKAHNEYLNYLATTGAFGLGSYLLLIGWFLFTAIRNFQFSIFNFQSKHQANQKTLLHHKSFIMHHKLISAALIASYLSILISQFFGFSVVITNLYFFSIPLFFYGLTNPALAGQKSLKLSPSISRRQVGALLVCASIAILLEYLLIRYWVADLHYAKGGDLARTNRYAEAYEELFTAIKLRPDEDLYKDELSGTLAVMSLMFLDEKDATRAAELARHTKKLSDELIQTHSHNVVYHRTRARLLYTLSQIDNVYLDDAITTLLRAQELAPSDPKILHHLTLFYVQRGDIDKAIEASLHTVQLKPDYRDARYTLALLYAEKRKQETDGEKREEYRKNAMDQIEYIFNHISREDQDAKELLHSLNTQ